MYDKIKDKLKHDPKIWGITGVAGFVGSNLLEELLKLNQHVIGLDNFSTGHRRNLNEVKSMVSNAQWKNFDFIEGDIRDINDCLKCCSGSDYVLHQAAIGSVPRSIADPITTNQNNIDGFLNVLVAARDSGTKRLIYASSSSVYGDNSELPKVVQKIGKPLSTYALTKLVNELYAEVFEKNYGLKAVGLRYFNLFGKRQAPNGPYAAVIPRWISSMINGEEVYINGDGHTSRDFCYVQNCIQANLLAATAEDESLKNRVYNVAVGDTTSLNQLFEYLLQELSIEFSHLKSIKPVYKNFRIGDILHSLADISESQNSLGYDPTYSIKKGLQESLSWYIKYFQENQQR